MSSKRVATSLNGGASKRQRRGVIGAPTQADDTARLIASHHLAERAGGGQSYLSTRSVGSAGRVRSLAEVALQVSAEGLLETLKLPPRAPGAAASVNSVGWDREREVASTEEASGLRDYVKSLPAALADRLMKVVVNLSAEAISNSNDGGGISVSVYAELASLRRTLILHFRRYWPSRLSSCTPTRRLYPSPPSPPPNSSYRGFPPASISSSWISAPLSLSAINLWPRSFLPSLSSRRSTCEAVRKSATPPS